MRDIPLYLERQPRWLLWRTEQRINKRTGEITETKVPIAYRTSKRCDVTEPRNWTEFANVTSALGRSRAWDGIGFALGVVEALGEIVIGLDLDACLDEDDDVAEWAQPFLAAMRSYAEISPSGTGIKILARVKLADLPEARRLLDVPEGDKEQARTRIFGERVNGAHAPGAQLFLMGRYFAVTGRHWPLSLEDVALLTLDQIARLAELFGPNQRRAADAKPRRGVNDDDTKPDDAALRAKLDAEFTRNPGLKARWEGGIEGLNDTTRSGRDMSVLAMLVTAGFAKGETRAALRLFEHGKLLDAAPRYFEQMWRRTKATPHVDPEPPTDWETQHPPRGEHLTPREEVDPTVSDGSDIPDGPRPEDRAQSTHGTTIKSITAEATASSLLTEPTPHRAAEASADYQTRSPTGSRAATPKGADPASREWPPPLDFFVDIDAPTPELRATHLPPALWPFVRDVSERMGVDPTSVAMTALVACASVMSDAWCLQPKRFDTTWTENPRLWAAIVGDPSIMKSPVIATCTKPIERLEVEARQRHSKEMREHKTKLAAHKSAKNKKGPEPTPPKLARYLIEGTTIEALSEALRDDEEGTQYAPAKKVLSRQDERAEFIANLDRYRAGGRGGGDRGAYLRLYNGGRYSIDRIIRGTFSIPNWSACLLGGIQPAPIQRIAQDADDDGLLERFVYCVPARQLPGLDRKPDADALQRYDALFPTLTPMQPSKPAHGGQHTPVILHPDAHQHREDINSLARAMAALPDTSARLRAAFEKWPGLFARLCLTFHLIDIADAGRTGQQRPPPKEVPEATARRVTDFMHDIVLPHQLRAEAVMFSTAQTSHAQWIAGYILAHGMERITVRDIMRSYRALSSPEARDELDPVMASLVAVGWLEPEPPRSPVKPVLAWRVNPAVHTAFKARAEHERELREQARQQLKADVEALRRKRREAA